MQIGNHILEVLDPHTFALRCSVSLVVWSNNGGTGLAERLGNMVIATNVFAIAMRQHC